MASVGYFSGIDGTDFDLVRYFLNRIPEKSPTAPLFRKIKPKTPPPAVARLEFDSLEFLVLVRIAVSAAAVGFVQSG